MGTDCSTLSKDTLVVVEIAHETVDGIPVIGLLCPEKNREDFAYLRLPLHFVLVLDRGSTPVQ